MTMDLPTVQSIYHSLCKQPLRVKSSETVFIMNWLLLLWLQRHKPNRNMASGPCHRHVFSSRMGPGSYHSGQDVKGGFRFLRTQKEG